MVQFRIDIVEIGVQQIERQPAQYKYDGDRYEKFVCALYPPPFPQQFLFELRASTRHPAAQLPADRRIGQANYDDG